MNILVRVTLSDPECRSPNYGLVSLDSALALRLLNLHSKARAFLEELSAGGITDTFDPISFGLKCAPFVVFNENEEMSEMLTDANDGSQIQHAVADGKFGFGFNLDAGDERIECYRVQLFADFVRFTALAHYGNQRFTTADIPTGLIEQAIQEPSMVA